MVRGHREGLLSWLNVPHSQFDLNTNLQAVAVNVTLSKKVTICSIYLPPSDTLSKNSLVNLIDQLPHPFMLVGDFNGHSKVWGCSDTNDTGEIIEDVIAENDQLMQLCTARTVWSNAVIRPTLSVNVLLRW